jgi:hypothetical protein
VDRKPNLGRQLGREAVKAERRKQADSASRHSLAGLGKRVVLRGGEIRKEVESSGGTHQETTLMKAAQGFGVNAVGGEIPHAEHPPAAGEFEELSSGLGWLGCV